VCANEQRRNTPSFGAQYGYGAFNGSGVFEWEGNNPNLTNRTYPHRDFRYGGAMGIRIRYSLDQTHAVGVSFEDLRCGRKSGLENPQNRELEPAKQLQVTNYLFDYYLYLNRRARTTPYLLFGGGFHRDTFRFGKYDNVATAIGPCANLGIGVEYFVRPAWSIDATLRGAWFGQRDGGQLQFHGSAPMAASLQLGFQYYLIK
jgi:opacity protein-like surface antigen